MDVQWMVRDAEEADLPALTTLKGAGSEAVHRDRLRDAQNGSIRYLVLLEGQEVIGSCCLVFSRPSHWSDADDKECLPQIVDIRVKPSLRGQGCGTAFIREIERIAAARARQIYIRVEPLDNPRAYALYQRLGYQPLQPEPYQMTWEFTDSAGKLNCGADWVIDLVKQLGA